MWINCQYLCIYAGLIYFFGKNPWLRLNYFRYNRTPQDDRGVMKIKSYLILYVFNKFTDIIYSILRQLICLRSYCEGGRAIVRYSPFILIQLPWFSVLFKEIKSTPLMFYAYFIYLHYILFPSSRIFPHYQYYFFLLFFTRSLEIQT